MNEIDFTGIAPLRLSEAKRRNAIVANAESVIVYFLIAPSHPRPMHIP